MIVIVIGLVVVLLDQVTKTVLRQALLLGESHPLIVGCLNLTHLRNTGAIWGMFQSHNEWLVLLSLLVLLLIAVFYRWLVDQRGIYRVALGLMIGGIIGNLIDRIRLGWVIDFIDFYWQANHWPAFNFADAAICLGVIIYLLSVLRSPPTAIEDKRLSDIDPSSTA